MEKVNRESQVRVRHIEVVLPIRQFPFDFESTYHFLTAPQTEVLIEVSFPSAMVPLVRYISWFYPIELNESVKNEGDKAFRFSCDNKGYIEMAVRYLKIAEALMNDDVGYLRAVATPSEKRMLFVDFYIYIETLPEKTISGAEIASEYIRQTVEADKN